IKSILDPKLIPEAVNSLRDYFQIHGKDEVIKGVKKLLPGATISAQFDKKRKTTEPHAKNKMVALDIDNVDVEVTIKKLEGLNICFWISRSISGKGVYALV